MIHAWYHRPLGGMYFSTTAKKERMFDVSYEITLMQGKLKVYFIDPFKGGLKQNVSSNLQ